MNHTQNKIEKRVCKHWNKPNTPLIEKLNMVLLKKS